MPKSGTSGSVRGAVSNDRPYRDKTWKARSRNPNLSKPLRPAPRRQESRLSQVKQPTRGGEMSQSKTFHPEPGRLQTRPHLS